MARNYNNGLDYITEVDESRYDDEVFYESSFLTVADDDENAEEFVEPDDEFDDDDVAWWEDDADLEMGFDPYEGTYTWDC